MPKWVRAKAQGKELKIYFNPSGILFTLLTTPWGEYIYFFSCSVSHKVIICLLLALSLAFFFHSSPFFHFLSEQLRKIIEMLCFVSYGKRLSRRHLELLASAMTTTTSKETRKKSPHRQLVSEQKWNLKFDSRFDLIDWKLRIDADFQLLERHKKSLWIEVFWRINFTGPRRIADCRYLLLN